MWQATYTNLTWQLYNVAKNSDTPFGSDETQSVCLSVSQYSFTSLSDTKEIFYPANISICQKSVTAVQTT